MKTLVVFAILTIAALIIIILIQMWTGRSINIVEAVYDFFSGLTGINLK